MRATVASLPERLLQRIAREGPISFYDFMQAALYDPADGYYTRGAAIGEGGDFLTSPHTSPAFAAALARLFSVEADAGSSVVDLVDVGAADGRFLEDFALALSRIDPQLHECLRLTAVEGSPAGRRAIAERGIEPEPRILGSAAELEAGSVQGWIFSNELYDALPVVRVVGDEDGPRELRVGAEGDRFVWTGAPAPRRSARAPRPVRRRARARPEGRDRAGRRGAPPDARPGAPAGARSSRSTTGTRRGSCTTRSRAPRERSPCTRAAAAAATRWSARASGT